MPCKYVVVPADVTLLDGDDKPVMKKDGEVETPLVVTFSKALLGVLNHPRLAANVAALKSNNLLKRKLKAAKPGDVLEVPEEDHKRLAAILDDPDKLDEKGQQNGVNVLSSLVGYSPVALPQLVSFFEAWVDAASKPPAESTPA